MLISLLYLKLGGMLTLSCMQQAFQGEFKLLPGLETFPYGVLNESMPVRSAHGLR